MEQYDAAWMPLALGAREALGWPLWHVGVGHRDERCCCLAGQQRLMQLVSMPDARWGPRSRQGHECVRMVMPLAGT